MKNYPFNKTDLKYTFRLLAKNPDFALLSTLVLAGGLGISLIALTFCYTFFYKPIQITNGESIYHICSGENSCGPFKAFEFSQLRRDITGLENIGVYQSTKSIIELDDITLRVSSTKTEWNMFHLSSTNALIGRTLRAYDQEVGAESVVVLGYDFWQQKFNGKSDAIDSILSIDGISTRVVGVMPDGYLFPWASQIWLPISSNLLNPINNELIPVMTYSLLKENVSQQEASLEIANLMNRIRQLYPNETDDRLSQQDTGYISTLPMAEFGGITAMALILLINLLAGLIFVLACINVGTLLLARTNERLSEISIRVALGAPRKRLLLQTMGESIIISIVGGFLAVLVAAIGLESINLFATITGEYSLFAFWQIFHLDSSTLLGALIFVVLTILLTSTIPCWKIINGDFNAVMRDGTRGATGLKSGRFTRSLIVTSIAIVTLLFYLGGLAGSHAFAMRKNIFAFSVEGIVNAQPILEDERYTNLERQEFYYTLHSTLLQNSSIDSVLFRSVKDISGVEQEGVVSLVENDFQLPPVQIILAAGALNIYGANLLEGRSFTERDNQNSLLTVVVSRSLAERLWPEQPAVGKRLRVIDPGVKDQGKNPWRRVVGVVGNSISTDSQLFSRNSETLYLPLAQVGWEDVGVIIKASSGSGNDINRAISVLRQTIRKLDPEIPAYNVVPATKALGVVLKMFDLGMSFGISCIAFSFLVSISGIFGLTQNTIQLATQEIGTRRAIGATDSLIRRTFLLRSSKQVLLAFTIAMLVASPITYLILLFGGPEFIKSTLYSGLVVVFGLFGIIILAIFSPLNRILRLEPSDALRHV